MRDDHPRDRSIKTNHHCGVAMSVPPLRPPETAIQPLELAWSTPYNRLAVANFVSQIRVKPQSLNLLSLRAKNMSFLYPLLNIIRDKLPEHIQLLGMNRHFRIQYLRSQLQRLINPSLIPSEHDGVIWQAGVRWYNGRS
jgi:hypothetical protein